MNYAIYSRNLAIFKWMKYFRRHCWILADQRTKQQCSYTQPTARALLPFSQLHLWANLRRVQVNAVGRKNQTSSLIPNLPLVGEAAVAKRASRCVCVWVWQFAVGGVSPNTICTSGHFCAKCFEVICNFNLIKFESSYYQISVKRLKSFRILCDVKRQRRFFVICFSCRKPSYILCDTHRWPSNEL